MEIMDWKYNEKAQSESENENENEKGNLILEIDIRNCLSSRIY